NHDPIGISGSGKHVLVIGVLGVAKRRAESLADGVVLDGEDEAEAGDLGFKLGIRHPRPATLATHRHKPDAVVEHCLLVSNTIVFWRNLQAGGLVEFAAVHPAAIIGMFIAVLANGRLQPRKLFRRGAEWGGHWRA